MSDTPRTEVAIIPMHHTAGVSLDFARQLERELTAARAEVSALKAEVERLNAQAIKDFRQIVELTKENEQLESVCDSIKHNTFVEQLAQAKAEVERAVKNAAAEFWRYGVQYPGSVPTSKEEYQRIWKNSEAYRTLKARKGAR